VLLSGVENVFVILVVYRYCLLFLLIVQFEAKRSASGATHSASDDVS
jgi:hypothetical protein